MSTPMSTEQFSGNTVDEIQSELWKESFYRIKAEYDALHAQFDEQADLLIEAAKIIDVPHKTYAQAIDDAIIIVLDRGRRIGGAIDPVKTAVALNALKRNERP